MASKKRLLVLTPRFPYPVIGGDRLRIMHICRALMTKFELTLLSLCESPEEMTVSPIDTIFKEIHRVYLPRWKSFCNVLFALPTKKPLQLAYYESKEFYDKVKELLPQYDLALAHLIRTGQYLEHAPIPSILEMTDAISLNYERMQQVGELNSWKELVYKVERKRLGVYERETVLRFRQVWLTSDIDRQYLLRDSQGKLPIEVIPNGVDVKALSYRPPALAGNVIVFIGNMVSAQNQDACHYFIRKILPKLRDRADVRFRIVGNAPPHVVRRFGSHPHVEVTGRLANIQDGIENAFCGVCPVRAAAGIQNKILEYLALGIPCVSSEIGIEGIEAEVGKDLFAYKNEEGFLQQVLALYLDPEMRASVALSGRKLVESQYNWTGIYKRFEMSGMKVANGFSRE